MENYTLSRNNFIHGNVVFFNRHIINKLEVETKANFFCCTMLAEKAVVVALAPSQAVALSVESHSRDDDEVVTTDIGLVLRFKNVEVAHGEIGLGGQFYRDDVVTHHCRQDDTVLLSPFLDESLCLHFVG